jgi:sugar phosphate isomerase/epimerase
MTTSHHDLPRYRDNQDLKQFYREHHLDGLELMEGGRDEAGLIAADDIIGVHLKYFHDWIGLWRGDMQAVLDEHGSTEMVEQLFGGLTRDALIESYKKNLQFAGKYSPEYVVFHVSNVSLEQCVTGKTRYTDEEVIEAVIELINILFTGDDDFILLFENLWWTGLTMTRPEITRRLLDGVRYKKKGIMLDIGHLLNTNTSLRSIDEGINYIHKILDSYDDPGFIRGIHLHQSLSGEYAEYVMRNPIKTEGTYIEKALALQSHILKIDTHKPFASKRIGAVLKRIAPDYVVLELISSNREEHSRYLREQLITLRAGAWF